MNMQLQIQFRGVEESDFIYNAIWDRAEKLEKFFRNIMECHVCIESPHRSKNTGTIYHVQIRLHIPGQDIIHSSEPEKNGAHEDVYVAIRDAFEAVTRKMEDRLRRRRDAARQNHPPVNLARVEKIFYQDGYGFLMTRDGREVYFHENSVLNGGFEALDVGDEVRFYEELGEKGPQVTSMSLIRHRETELHH